MGWSCDMQAQAFATYNVALGGISQPKGHQ